MTYIEGPLNQGTQQRCSNALVSPQTCLLSPKHLFKLFPHNFRRGHPPQNIYAAPVWCTVAKGRDGSIQPPKKLCRLTTSAARQITRCLRSTPTNILLGLAGLPEPSFLLAYQVALRMSSLLRLPRARFHLLPPSYTINFIRSILIAMNVPLIPPPHSAISTLLTGR